MTVALYVVVVWLCVAALAAWLWHWWLDRDERRYGPRD